MKKLEFGKPVIGWIETGSENSNQMLVGLRLEHRNSVQCQVVLEATCCGHVLPAAKRGWNTPGRHNDGLVCNNALFSPVKACLGAQVVGFRALGNRKLDEEVKLRPVFVLTSFFVSLPLWVDQGDISAGNITNRHQRIPQIQSGQNSTG